jgi:hypothetical protein
MPLLPHTDPPAGPTTKEMEELAGDLITRAAGMLLCLQSAGYNPRDDAKDLLALNLMGPTITLAVGGDPRLSMEQTVAIAESLNIFQVRKLLEG